MTTGLNAGFNGSVFNKDFPMVIATKRELATLLPVVLAYDAAGYEAGRVLALNTVSNQYTKYVSGGASGTGTAVAVLFQATGDMLTNQSDVGAGIFSGYLYKDKLVGLDAGAITSLGAHTIVPSGGANILKF